MNNNVETLKNVEVPPEFRKYFWEYRGIPLNLGEDKKLITERILCFGNMQSVKWLLQYLSTSNLLEIVHRSRNIDRKTYNFWTTILNEE